MFPTFKNLVSFLHFSVAFSVFVTSCVFIERNPDVNTRITDNISVNLYGVLIANSLFSLIEVFVFLAKLCLPFKIPVDITASVIKLLELITWVLFIAVYGGVHDISSLVTLVINTLASGILRRFLLKEEPLLVMLNGVLIWSSFATVVASVISKGFSELHQVSVIFGFLSMIIELWIRSIADFFIDDNNKKRRSIAKVDEWDTLWYIPSRILIIVSITTLI